MTWVHIFLDFNMLRGKLQYVHLLFPDRWMMYLFPRGCFVGFVLCLSWAVASLWRFSHLGLRVSPRPQSSCVSPGPQSGCPTSPCILPLSWSFHSIWSQTFMTSTLNLFITSSVPWRLSHTFHLHLSMLQFGWFPQSHLNALRHNDRVFHFGSYTFIARESVWLLCKVRLNWYFSLNCSFIMDSNPSFVIFILFYRLFKIDIISANLVLLVMSVDSSL